MLKTLTPKGKDKCRNVSKILTIIHNDNLYNHLIYWILVYKAFSNIIKLDFITI